VLTRPDPPVPPAAAGGLLEFTRVSSANLREQDDHWNHAVGGFFAGAVLGVRSRNMPTNTLEDSPMLTAAPPSP
jgi:hypothetical protein